MQRCIHFFKHAVKSNLSLSRWHHGLIMTWWSDRRAWAKHIIASNISVYRIFAWPAMAAPLPQLLSEEDHRRTKMASPADIWVYLVATRSSVLISASASGSVDRNWMRFVPGKIKCTKPGIHDTSNLRCHTGSGNVAHSQGRLLQQGRSLLALNLTLCWQCNERVCRGVKF